MRKLVFAALACACFSASADLVYRGDSVMLRLTEQACFPVISAMLPDQYKPKFKGGYAVVNGRPLRLCWAPDGDTILIIDEEGDAGRVPASAFKESNGV